MPCDILVSCPGCTLPFLNDRIGSSPQECKIRGDRKWMDGYTKVLLIKFIYVYVHTHKHILSIISQNSKTNIRHNRTTIRPVLAKGPQALFLKYTHTSQKGFCDIGVIPPSSEAHGKASARATDTTTTQAFHQQQITDGGKGKRAVCVCVCPQKEEWWRFPPEQTQPPPTP